MNEITFDFNNLLNFNIGPKHGVSLIDIGRLEPKIRKCHEHLQSVVKNPKSRFNLDLVWTQLPYQDEKVINRVEELAAEICANFENVISLGIGGSYLGLKAAQDALCAPYYNEFSTVRNNRPKIYFEGNNLDPVPLKVLLANLDPKKTFVIVISKSGETTETKAAFEAIQAWLQNSLGASFGRQILAITDPESGSLRKVVNLEQKKDNLSFRSLPLLKGIGGRYSEFNMGLLHLAIIGADIRNILEGAKAMALRCNRGDLYRNPAYLYAALHFILYKKKSKPISILMPFSENLKSTADWYAQLLAESLGKKYERKIIKNKDGSEQWLEDLKRQVNVGPTPVICRGTTDLHSIQQNNVEGENNKIITFVRIEEFGQDISIPGSDSFLSGRRLGELLDLAQEATQWSLTRAQRPNCTISLPCLDAFNWAGLLFFFQMATAFEGELLNVNAFNQPGVESYKNYLYYKLNKPGISADIQKQIKAGALIKRKKFII
jgi:glucose-6-phosphate isomerase